MTAATYDFVRYRGADGDAKHVVRKLGRKYHSLVEMGHPIVVHKVGLDDECFMTPVAFQTLASAVERFLDAATRCGITAAAEEILIAAKAQETNGST